MEEKTSEPPQPFEDFLHAQNRLRRGKRRQNLVFAAVFLLALIG